jgi:choline kinase
MSFPLTRAVLISAGRGSRLGALTDNTPKCLVKVAGKAIIDHQIHALHESGVEEIIVVAGFRREAIAAHIAKMDAADRPAVIFNPFWSVSSSIGSVWEARAFLNAPFCLINGDTIFDAPLLRSALARVRPGVNLLVDGGPFEPDDMRVEVDGARILAVGKKLPDSANLFRSLGMIVSTSADGEPYLGALEHVISQPEGRLSYHHDIIDRLAKEVAVHPVIVDKGHWREIDSPEDIRAYEEFLVRFDAIR